MLSKRALRGWGQMLVNQGVVATFRTALTRIRQRTHPVQREPDPEPERETWQAGSRHPFDLQYGVDTSGLIWGEDLPSGGRSDRWSTAYYGIAPSVFDTAMSRLPADLSRYTFIDIGSGKGRAVMLATRYPFAEIYGVELAPQLHAVAESNLRIFRGKTEVEAPVHLKCMDAVALPLPKQPLVLFFYHPFCKPVLKRVLRNLEASLRAHPRQAYVVYINTELRDILNRATFLERISEETLEMSAEDRLADRIGSSVEECAIYKSVPSTP
ncbi:MAG: class I SAM-dependent methyltransferase [Acidobacteriaceae bacterium]